MSCLVVLLDASQRNPTAISTPAEAPRCTLDPSQARTGIGSGACPLEQHHDDRYPFCFLPQAELQSTKKQVATNRAAVEQLYEARDSAQNTMMDIKVELDQARAEMQVLLWQITGALKLAADPFTFLCCTGPVTSARLPRVHTKPSGHLVLPCRLSGTPCRSLWRRMITQGTWSAPALVPVPTRTTAAAWGARGAQATGARGGPGAAAPEAWRQPGAVWLRPRR